MIRIFIFLLLILAVCGCSRQQPKSPANGKLPVVATIFPVYDFVRAIGGDRVSVALLLPPGAEPHSFEPKPADMVRVGQARLLVFTNPAMEPWAAKLLTGAGRERAGRSPPARVGPPSWSPNRSSGLSARPGARPPCRSRR